MWHRPRCRPDPPNPCNPCFKDEADLTTDDTDDGGVLMTWGCPVSPNVPDTDPAVMGFDLQRCRYREVRRSRLVRRLCGVTKPRNGRNMEAKYGMEDSSFCHHFLPLSSPLSEFR